MAERKAVKKGDKDARQARHEAMTFVNDVYQRADAFLFSRRTYELFAGYWGVQLETTGRCVVRRRVRDERAASAI